MDILLLVATGGFFGAVSRFSLGSFVQSKHSTPFPFGTFVINLTGSFLLGILFAQNTMHPLVFFFFGTGFMGSYTTFSTFQLESNELIRKNKILLCLVYLLSSALLGILFAYLGYRVGKMF